MQNQESMHGGKQQTLAEAVLRALRASGWAAFLLFLAVSLAVWRLEFAFFRQDEWYQVFIFALDGPEEYLKPFFGHVIPLFKLLFQAELAIFGTFAPAYQTISLLVWSLLGVLLWRFWGLLFPGLLWMPFLGVLFVLLHAMNFSSLLWGHQICLLGNLVFQVLLMWELWRITRGQAGAYSAARVGVYLILQQYLFNISIFFPALALLLLVLYRPWRAALGSRVFWVCAVLQLVFVVVHLLATEPYAVPHTVEGEAQATGYLHNPLERLQSGLVNALTMLGVLSWRMFFLKGLFVGSGEAVLGLLLFGLLFSGLWWGCRSYRRQTGWLTLWLLASVGTLGLARVELQEIPTRYSTTVIFPFSGLLVIAAQGVVIDRRLLGKRLAVAGGCLLLLGHLVVVQHLNNRFSKVNLYNKLQMEQALRQGKVYKPYYDPFVFLPEEVQPRTSPHYARYLTTSYRYLRQQGVLSFLERDYLPPEAEVHFPGVQFPHHYQRWNQEDFVPPSPERARANK